MTEHSEQNDFQLSRFSRSHSRNMCAFHPDQFLTNFCKCLQCLLPVCPTCVKLHTDQHAIKTSRLDEVFQEVDRSCASTLTELKRLSSQILKVEAAKHQNQALILEKVRLYRDIIVRQFNRAMTQLEYSIVQSLKNQDKNLVQKLSQIDERIEEMLQQVTQRQSSLQTQQGLRTIIFHFGKDVEEKQFKHIRQIQCQLKNILKKNYYLCIDEAQLENIKQNISGFLKLGIMDWKNNHKSN